MIRPLLPSGAGNSEIFAHYHECFRKTHQPECLLSASLSAGTREQPAPRPARPRLLFLFLPEGFRFEVVMGQKKDLKCFEGLMLQEFPYSFPNIRSTDISIYCTGGPTLDIRGEAELNVTWPLFLGTREETLHTQIMEDCVVQRPRRMCPGRGATLTPGRGAGVTPREGSRGDPREGGRGDPWGGRPE